MPLDRELDDFPLRMSKVLQTLEFAEQRSQLDILADLTMDNSTQAKENSGSVADLIVAGASTVLSVFPPTAALSGMASFGLFAWQRENQRKFEREIRDRVKNLDINKLDHSALQSDEFKSLIIETVEIASKSASELKRQALANAVVNSVIAPTSQFTSKQALLRVLSQISDEEILVITAIYKIQRSDRSKWIYGVSIADLAQEIKCNEQKIRIVCEALLQLKLIFEPPIQSQAYFSPDEPINVRRFNGLLVSDLGTHLIKWCGQETPTE